MGHKPLSERLRQLAEVYGLSAVEAEVYALKKERFISKSERVEANRQKAFEMRQTGITWTEIGKSLGVSSSRAIELSKSYERRQRWAKIKAERYAL